MGYYLEYHLLAGFLILPGDMPGDVEETIYVVEEDDEDEDAVKTIKKQSEMLFVRGDSVVLISPQSR